MALNDEVKAVMGLYSDIKPLMSKAMPDVGPELIKHLTRIDAYRFNFLTLAAVLSGHYRMNKGEAEGDRARVAAEIAEGAADAIKQRVTLGQSIMNYLVAEMRSGMQG